MARKRIGYTIEARERNEVRIAVDLYEKNDPERRVLELAVKGDTSSVEYKAALAAYRLLSESDDVASMKRLYRKITKTPVMLTLSGGAVFKGCTATMDLLDDNQRRILNRIASKGLAVALGEANRPGIEATFTLYGISCVEELPNEMYLLSVEKVGDEPVDDDE